MYRRESLIFRPGSIVNQKLFHTSFHHWRRRRFRCGCFAIARFLIEKHVLVHKGSQSAPSALAALRPTVSLAQVAGACLVLISNFKFMFFVSIFGGKEFGMCWCGLVTWRVYEQYTNLRLHLFLASNRQIMNRAQEEECLVASPLTSIMAKLKRGRLDWKQCVLLNPVSEVVCSILLDRILSEVNCFPVFPIWNCLARWIISLHKCQS